MLTQAENEMLTGVGAGTPMGRMLREHWLPAIFSDEVRADGDPLRIRLLGEDLLAFRDSQGRVGIVETRCPHRGAGLFHGRNEECGLRCVYHGWKFDVEGRCVDMPSEPPESSFKDKIQLLSYPVLERNGIVWAYMVRRASPPQLPALEWNLVPPSQVHASKRVQDCNWVQALEGGIDPSHVSFLHAPLQPSSGPGAIGERLYLGDKHPRFEMLETPYGMRIGSRRNVEEGRLYWSITHFMMPWYNAFNALAFTRGDPHPTVGGFAWVPMDDTTTMAWCFTWNHYRPLAENEIAERFYQEKLGGGVHVEGPNLLPATTEPGGAWRPVANSSNDYLIDRQAQRMVRFSGSPGMSAQDAAVQDSMGPIADRSREHLGSSDAPLIRMRRAVLRAAVELDENGTAPPGVDVPESYRVRPAAVILAEDEDWTRAAADWVNAQPNAVAPVLS